MYAALCTWFRTRTLNLAQYQKPDPSKDAYTYSVTLFDPTNNVIASSDKAPAAPNTAIILQPNPAFTFEILSGYIDDDPVYFRYNGAQFDSGDGHCKMGAYDNGKREGELFLYRGIQPDLNGHML